MTIWIDAQLSPQLAPWIKDNFKVEARPVRDLGLRDAEDREIFLAARKANAVVMSKDEDFLNLLEQMGPPPQILWVTTGNSSNSRLKELLTKTFEQALNLLRQGEPLVEVSDAL